MDSIEKMREYNEKTTKNGIIMPNVETFDNKVDMVISLWPQINDRGKIDYLFGKGVGVELALRGNVVGREKNSFVFPYRSHADFEIYNCYGYDKIFESKDFLEVFGAQEWYPKDCTKGLHDIEDGVMDSTYDTVIYNDKEYLVPELELLFLDKFLNQESTPRREGYDAYLLMQQYKLDINKINDYYDKYVKKYQISHYDIAHKNSYDRQLKSINRIINSYLNDNYYSNNIKDTEMYVNKEIDKFRDLEGNVGIYGSPVRFYPKPIKLFLNSDNIISISDDTKKQIKVLLLLDREEFINSIDIRKDNINSIYNSIYGSRGKK